MSPENQTPTEDLTIAHEFTIWLSKRSSAPTCKTYLGELQLMHECATGMLHRPLLADESIEYTLSIIGRLYSEEKLSKPQKKVAAYFISYLAQKKASEATGDSYTTAPLAPTREGFENWLMSFLGLGIPAAGLHAERIDEISSRLAALELSMYTVGSIRELKSWEPCLKNIMNDSRQTSLDYYYAYLCCSIAYNTATMSSGDKETTDCSMQAAGCGFEAWCLAKEIGLPTIKQTQAYIELLSGYCRERGMAFNTAVDDGAATVATLLDLYTHGDAYDEILTGVKELNSIDRYSLYQLDCLPEPDLETILTTKAERGQLPFLVVEGVKQVAAKFRAWITENDYAPDNSARTFVSSLYSCEDLIREQFGDSIMENCNKRKVAYLALVVSEHKDFNRNWKRPLRLFLQFLSAVHPISLEEHQQNQQQLEQLLLKRFDGILPHGDYQAIYPTWENESGSPLMYGEDDLARLVKQITIHDKKRGIDILPTVWLPAETKEQLTRYINSIFEQNCPVVDYAALLHLLPEQDTPVELELLRQYLTLTGKGSFVCETKHIRAIDSCKSKDNFPALVCNKLKEIERPVSTDELMKLIPGISEDTIRRVLSQNNLGANIGIINPKKGDFFHADIIRFTASEMQGIDSAILEKLLSANDYITVSQLHDIVVEKAPDVLERHPFLSQDSLYKVLRYKLGAKFNFNLACITFRESVDIQSKFQSFCAGKRKVTWAELSELKGELNVTNIPFDLIYKTHAHVDQDNFISRDELHFDTQATDNILKTLCREDFIPMGCFHAYEKLPPVSGYQWTPFLLEHYLAYHSKDFTYLKRNFAISGCHGFIARRAAGITDFDEAVARYICTTDVAFNKDDILLHLREIGLIGRRTYTGIDHIVQRAREMNE